MGMLSVVFVIYHETIQQLFFECALAKFICRVIHITFGLSIPNNIKHVFDGWVQKMNDKDKKTVASRSWCLVVVNMVKPD
jgi:hypothetical protein